MAKVTISVADLKAMDRELLPPSIVSKVIGVDPYWLNIAARDKPALIPFPFLVTGTTKKCIKFPRLALIKWLEG